MSITIWFRACGKRVRCFMPKAQAAGNLRFLFKMPVYKLFAGFTELPKYSEEEQV
ncbi:hypothetical protein SK3146_06765 [Paenibacillus konkukensis]|uniref:Uncharacterized protein n=1 Tax=Paenibacillus konkukensis TaxID=2020716 RepID=A0ABY4S1Z4_9BACL|nr:hypothetical protein SK3146_06765 [Paenibacillus konkukensis]